MTVVSNWLSGNMNPPPTSSDAAMPDLFSELPIDVLGGILSYLTSSWDILNLSLTSKSIHPWVLPSIYHSIEIRDAKQCFNCVQYLISRPDIARTVMSLTLRPSFLKTASKKLLNTETTLSHVVELLAPNLIQLKEFIWDGLEAPPSRMWASLRRSCPDLKTIGTNLGREDIDPNSELFAFDDLLSFSLTTELRYDLELYLRSSEPLPQPLWTMLIDRCPRLRSLVIGDGGKTMHRIRKLNFLPLTAGRWQHLESLAISNARLYDVTLSAPIDEFAREAANQSFFEFMHAHQPTLRRLRLHELGNLILLEDHDTMLTHRSCPLPYNLNLFAHCQTLHSLELIDIAHCGAFFATFKRYVINLPILTRLALWVDFSQSEAATEVVYDEIDELKNVVQLCPRLEDLTVFSSTKRKETFLVQDFSRVITHTRLKRVELWKCRKTGDIPFKDAARQFVQCEAASPVLNSIIFTACFDQWGPSPLERKIKRMNVIETGSYRFHRTDTGRADSMMVNEQRNFRSSSPWARRYEMPLTPLKVNFKDADGQIIGKRLSVLIGNMRKRITVVT